ncbi:hypothetical protein [Microbacterium sp.]|uniref:hypothetical protein n=1 Tax=Microbacterium sp. TaxID=51671 RepID=UPI0035642307
MTRTRGSVAQRQRTQFFEEGKRENAPCWLCDGPIDYTVKPSSTHDSHNLDHYHPVATHPHLQNDRDGWRHSHASCNKSRGTRAPSRGLGEPVPDWW